MGRSCNLPNEAAEGEQEAAQPGAAQEAAEAAEAAEAVLEDAAAAEVAATAAAEAAVSGLDLSRSASEPPLGLQGEMRTSLTPCGVACWESSGALRL